ncbi:MAG: hypothetical protein AB1749_15160 [Pseudomonadota bacterium]
MIRSLFAATLVGVILAAAPLAQAAPGEAASKTGWPKPTQSVKPDQKLCKYKFSDGTHKVWVCAKAEPCCEWEALGNYVKCGSTITGCL